MTAIWHGAGFSSSFSLPNFTKFLFPLVSFLCPFFSLHASPCSSGHYTCHIWRTFYCCIQNIFFILIFVCVVVLKIGGDVSLELILLVTLHIFGCVEYVDSSSGKKVTYSDL